MYGGALARCAGPALAGAREGGSSSVCAGRVTCEGCESVRTKGGQCSSRAAEGGCSGGVERSGVVVGEDDG